MKKHIILFALMVVAATACNNKEVDPTAGTLSGHYIGFGEVSIDPVMAKSGNQVLVSDTQEQTISDNFSISGNVIVEPIGADLFTKAVGDKIAVPGEITRDNLPSFYVDGFLDASNPHVTEDAHFITNAPTTYDKDATSENREIKGRWFFTPKTAYQWRNRVLHYFWAYSSGSNVTATKDALEFDFDTDNMSKDLVIAYHEQYWDDSHVTDKSATTTYHDGEDELRILPFKHAVSAVALQNSIQFAKFNKEKPADPVGGKYRDEDLGPNVKDEDESTPRLELIYAGIQAFNSGHVKTEANSGSFVWSDLDGYKKGVTTAINGTSTYFEIPQLVNTTQDYNENAVAIFSIRDNKLTKTQDFPIRLPRFTAGSDPEYWVAGNYYKYIFNGRFIAPFVPEGQEDGYPANFAGQGNQLNIPFEPIDFTYIHTINVKWTNLGYCNSNGYHIYMIVSPRIIEYTDTEWKDGTPIKKINEGQILINETTDVVFFEQVEKIEVSTFYEHECGDNYIMTIDGVPITYDKTYPNTALQSSFEINNIDVSKMTGKNYIYILYAGGNNANSNWVLEDISLEIVD